MNSNWYEKVVLMMIAYFVGVMTTVVYYVHVEPLEVINNSAQSKVIVSTPKIERSIKTVSGLTYYKYSDGDLNVFTKNDIRTLSSFTNTDLLKPKQGIHYSTPVTIISNDNNFLFFCEQQAKKVDYCHGYVYSFAEDSINPILIDSDAFVPTMDLANDVFWQEGKLNLGNMRSISEKTPWLLTE